MRSAIACDGCATITRTEREGAIETFFLDWGGSFAIGLLFGWIGRRAPGAMPMSSRAFRLGLAYLLLGFFPIALALYVAQPDWMWMYWVRASDLPVAAVVLSFAVYGACYVAGFTVAEAAERARPGAGLAFVGAAAAALVAAEATARTRLWRFGSFEEFHAGTAEPALSTGAGWGLLIAGTLSLASLALLASRARRA